MRHSRSSVKVSQESDPGCDSPAVFSRPGSRAAACSFKTREDDIGAAMAAVKRVMRAKQKVGSNSPDMALTHSASSPSLRTSMQSELLQHEIEAQRDADQQRSISREDMPWAHGLKMERHKSTPEEEMPCARGLKAAMTSGNLLLLQNAIENAAAAGVPVALIDEARATLKLEGRLQDAIAEADLSEVRKVVGEVKRGKICAALPREPPFAIHQSLQYWSEMRQDWVNCRVVDTSPDGKILINLKKKTDHWYSLREQGERFRLADANVSTAARHVRLDTASALLLKADALQSAVRSEDFASIEAALARGRREKALAGLVARAEAFVKESTRRQSVDEAEASSDAAVCASSDAAAAWSSAKQKIQRVWRAKADSVWAETAEKCAGSQEWELALGRLRQLEEDLRSTDLSALRHTVDALGDDGLDTAVVDEAGRALSALRAEMDGLQAAIESADVEKKKRDLVQARLFAALRDGDVDTLRAMLETIDDYSLPEALIRKARATLAIAVTIEAAIKAEDLVLLDNILAEAEQESVDTSFVQRAHCISRASKALQAAIHCGDVDAIEKAMAAADVDGVPATLVAHAGQKLAEVNEAREAQNKRDHFLLHLDILIQSHDTLAMRAAIHEGEALGFRQELDVLRNAHEKELSHMRAKALEFRSEQEKLAAEFKTAKEAQDLGGAILVAQWRAAVSAVAKPFVFSEEDECARYKKGLKGL